LLRESPSRIRVGDRRPNGGANSGSCAALRGGASSFAVPAPRGRIGEATECLRRNPTSASGGAALKTCRCWPDTSMLPARTILERARASAPRAVGDRAVHARMEEAGRGADLLSLLAPGELRAW